MPHFLTLNVFTSAPHAGNQLAVVFSGNGLDDGEMLGITRDFNYSETTFVLPPTDPGAACTLRIFTPGREIPFAGHPTIGSAIALVHNGTVQAHEGENELVLQEGVGPVPVRVRVEKGKPVFAQFSVAMLPEPQPLDIERRSLAAMLGLTSDDLLDEPYGPQVVSCGIPFLFVPVRNRDAVGRAGVRQHLWEKELRGTPGSDIMVFCMDPDGDADIHARVFVPGHGIPEDPATGSACAALGGYLANRTPRDNTTLRWIVRQGVEMGRPSRIELEVDKHDGMVAAVRVGGPAVVTSRGELLEPAGTAGAAGTTSHDTSGTGSLHAAVPASDGGGAGPVGPAALSEAWRSWTAEYASYPIGRYAVEEVTRESLPTLLDDIAQLPGRVRQAVRGWGDAELDTPYRQGGWTVRQLVHHLPDSHINAYIRMRLALTEDTPTIRPYQEKLWAELWDARTGPVELSLSLLDALHARWTVLLRSCDLAALRSRAYYHPEMGLQTLDQVVHHYAWHGRHHLAHIVRVGEFRNPRAQLSGHAS